MIKGLQSRPMVRPLFVWIVGVLLQTCFSVNHYSILLLFPLVALFLSLKKIDLHISLFSGRWTWGFYWAILLLFLSIQFTSVRQQTKEIGILPAAISRQASSFQQAFISSIDELNLKDEEKSVLSTLVLGYRQSLPKDVRRQFVVTGTSHILAVSGMHVAIVCGFFSLLLSLFPFRHNSNFLLCIFTLFFIWGYVWITGCAPSAIRSGWMMSFYIVGKYLVKHADNYNTLAATAFCMLVFDPFYLFDVGFQLSFIAVFFILYFEPLLKIPFSIKNPLIAIPFGWVTIAVAAQLGVTLLTLYYFGYTSLLFLFTALPVSLLVTLLLPVSVIWLLYPASFPGYFLLQATVEKTLRTLYELIERFSHLQDFNITVSLEKWQVAIGYIFLIGCIEYFRRNNRRYLHKKSYL